MIEGSLNDLKKLPMFQHASEDRRATGSYLWSIRQPGGKGVQSYLFGTLQERKKDIKSLIPTNVMEAFEVLPFGSTNEQNFHN